MTFLTGFHTPLLLPPRRPSAACSPPYNQRKARKARRQRFANGDHHAFRR